MAERNAIVEVARDLPGRVLIGDGSGGQGVLLALAHPVFLCDLGSLAEVECVPLRAARQDGGAAGQPAAAMGRLGAVCDVMRLPMPLAWCPAPRRQGWSEMHSNTSIHRGYWALQLYEWSQGEGLA
ncbi:MAG: hypothetical protein ABW002_15480 [Xanthomonas sp.]